MRHTKTTLGLAITVAFAAGIVLSPLLHRAISDAHAAAAPLTPAIIDLAALKHADLPATSNPEQHSKTLIVTDNATLAIHLLRTRPARCPEVIVFIVHLVDTAAMSGVDAHVNTRS